MKNKNNFWKKPRNISIVIDNPSWIWPYIPKFCDELILLGDKVKTFKNYEDIPNGDIAIFLSCINIAPETILKKNIKNLFFKLLDRFCLNFVKKMIIITEIIFQNILSNPSKYQIL